MGEQGGNKEVRSNLTDFCLWLVMILVTAGRWNSALEFRQISLSVLLMKVPSYTCLIQLNYIYVSLLDVLLNI